jgi:hypothetical protein
MDEDGPAMQQLDETVLPRPRANNSPGYLSVGPRALHEMIKRGKWGSLRPEARGARARQRGKGEGKGLRGLMEKAAGDEPVLIPGRALRLTD